MATFTRYNPFKQDKQILRSPALVQQDRSAQLVTDYVSRDTEGDRTILAGSFVARTYAGAFRVLPRVKVATAVATGQNLIEDCVYSNVFVPGDVLTIQGTYALFDVAATTAGTLTYNGRTVSVTPTGAGTNGEAAVLFAEGFTNSFLGNTFYFVADEDNAQLYVFSKDGISVDSITGDGVKLQGTVGLVGDPQVLAYNDTAIGTVSYVSETNGDIVLVANAAIAVPVGVPIGVTIQQVYGLLNNSYVLSVERPNYDVGLITRAKVILSGLPYYDDTIKTDLPEIDPSVNP